MKLVARLHLGCRGNQGIRESTGEWRTFVRHRLRHTYLEELMAVTWHPIRVVEWCFDQGERREMRGLDLF